MNKIVATSRNIRNGFTLIELLVCIGIIAILAAIIIAAINPSKQIKDARNAQRRSDIGTILNAVYQYMLDHEGSPPPSIDSESTQICKTGAISCNNGVDLNVLTGTYLVSIPVDPTADVTGTGTDYRIFIDQFGRITLEAPNAELGLSISR